MASIRLEVVRVFKDQLDLANVRANVRHVVPAISPLTSERNDTFRKHDPHSRHIFFTIHR